MVPMGYFENSLSSVRNPANIIVTRGFMRILIPVSLLLTMAAPLCAAERIEYRMPPGFAYSFDNTTDASSVLDVTSGGQRTTLEQKLKQRIKGSVEVLKSSGGVPTLLRIHFDPVSGTTTTTSGNTDELPFALAGETVEVAVSEEQVTSVRNAEGRELSRAGALDEDSLSVVSEIAVAERAILPDGPVGIGDRWTARLARNDRPLTPELNLEVAGFGDRAGRRIAKADVDGTLRGVQQGLDMDGELSGPVIFDVDSGMPVSSRLSGSIAVNGAVEQNGTAMGITGSQFVTITTNIEIGPATGTDAGPAAVSSTAASTENLSPSDWTEFRHSLGSTLRHPSAWRTEEFPEGVRIHPAKAAGSETIVVTGIAANGATDPMAPDVGAYLDATLQQMLPGLRRTGEPVSVAAANGRGALYRYAGKGFDGAEMLCHVYVTIENGVAFSLSAVAPPATLRSRTGTLEKIFASIELGSPATATAGGTTPTGDDPRLIGMFKGESLAGGDYGAYVNTQLAYVLNADGTVYYGAQSHFSSSSRDYNGNLRWSASGVTDGSVQSGRWSARNGMLTVVWDNGQRAVFAYGFEPDGNLVLRHPTTRKLINFFSRVR